MGEGPSGVVCPECFNGIQCRYALFPEKRPEGFDPACNGPIDTRLVTTQNGILYFCHGHGEAHRKVNPFTNIYEKFA